MTEKRDVPLTVWLTDGDLVELERLRAACCGMVRPVQRSTFAYEALRVGLRELAGQLVRQKKRR